MNSLLLFAQENGAAALSGLAAFLCFGVIGLIGLVFWVWALIDAIKNQRLTDNERIIWVVVIVFLQVLGALIYLIAGRKK